MTKDNTRWKGPINNFDEVTRDEMTTGDERVSGRDELQVDNVACGQQWWTEKTQTKPEPAVVGETTRYTSTRRNDRRTTDEVMIKTR